MEKWYLAVRIFIVGFSCVFLILGLLVLSIKSVNAMLHLLPAPSDKK